MWLAYSFCKNQRLFQLSWEHWVLRAYSSKTHPWEIADVYRRPLFKQRGYMGWQQWHNTGRQALSSDVLWRQYGQDAAERQQIFPRISRTSDFSGAIGNLVHQAWPGHLKNSGELRHQKNTEGHGTISEKCRLLRYLVMVRTSSVSRRTRGINSWMTETNWMALKIGEKLIKK